MKLLNQLSALVAIVFALAVNITGDISPFEKSIILMFAILIGVIAQGLNIVADVISEKKSVSVETEKNQLQS